VSRPVGINPEYDVVVVGAGVLGLFTAHHLAKRMDPRRVLVLERGYLSAGASGRNGGGVRQQWEATATIRLAREAVAAYRRFPREFGYNPWFRQGGYLFLAFSEEEAGRLRKVSAAVRSEGLPVRWLEPHAILRRVPSLSPEGLVGGTYLSSDGVIFPFPVLWGLYQDLRRRGVEVRTRTEVLALRREGAQWWVGTSRGPVRASRVLNASGGWSRDVSALAGLTVPNLPSRHEILATEPVKPFLDPMVVTLRRGLYLSQSMRGEVIGGLTLEHPGEGTSAMPSSSAFLREMSAEMVRLFPPLASLRVLRSWAGFYDETPDGFPILGEDPRAPGFFHGNGFGGHGFMLAPAAAPRLAAMLLGERTDLEDHLFGPGRFLREGAIRPVEGLTLG
jgi:sarcosine oxidase subunit beta